MPHSAGGSSRRPAMVQFVWVNKRRAVDQHASSRPVRFSDHAARDHEAVEVEVFVPSSAGVAVPAFLCYQVQHTVCTSVGFFGGKGITSDDLHLKALTAGECWELQRTHRWGTRRLVSPSAGLWINKYHTPLPFLLVAGGMYHCDKHPFGRRRSGHPRWRKGDQLTRRCPGVCRYVNGNCLRNEHIFVWHPATTADLCRFRKINGTFESDDGWGKHVIIPSLQVAFKFSTSKFSAEDRACLPGGRPVSLGRGHGADHRKYDQTTEADSAVQENHPKAC